ncbi:cytochrome b [Pseudonocardia kunmingensis]|uniref:Cytochrome b561 n=1 Tax=Pseudonocardia kunmingensis TaxID=630975 RepID=A0A543DRW3_9PSEU|nr:cytochrome b/b6 domain-containing protein [Pseudonocardia kunmingensis]TQM12039.1 cytochrome b561 [Pseudonocardia kunmingensis]
MPLRNGAHGYGRVSKSLHWLTVGLITAQFVVGYRMADEDPALEREEDRLDALEDGCRAETDAGEAAEERCEEQLELREDALDARQDDVVGDALSGLFSGRAFGDGLSLPEWHVLLGLSIIVVAVVRLLWRATTPLPPWAESLSAGERRLESVLEKALLALLLLVPASGLLLVAGVAPVALHVAAHVVFFAVVGTHVGLVLRHTVIRRERHLSRML